MGSLFSNKQKTSGSQTATTQSNLWDNPALQQFLQGYNQQYSGAGGASTPINAYQTGAGDQQTGVAAGLQPAQGVANAIGMSGITPTSIQSFMSPYTQNVVDATRADFAKQNANDLSNVQGQTARMGALTGTGATVAQNLARESQRRQQDPIIANLYNQGYGQAANTAAQSAGLQLQGAGTAGSLANAATGANTALGNIGQNIWGSQYQNTMTPYSLYNQGIQGYQGLGNLAGTTSSGTSTGTTTTTPSLGSIALGGLGTILSGWPTGGFGGFGSGMGKAYGGAVEGVGLDSAAPNSLHDKVGAAFRLLQGLREGAKSGGRIEGYQAGGTPTWRDDVPQFDDDGQQAPDNLGMAQPETPQGTSSGGFSLPSLSKMYGDGVWAGERATPVQRFGSALAQIGNGPFAGFGKAMHEQQQTRIQEQQLQRLMEQLGLEQRRVQMQEAKTPAEIEQLHASANLARTNADKAFLLDIEKQKMANAKELASQEQLRKIESSIDDAVMYGAITPEEGEQRRQKARELYQMSRGQIEDVRTTQPERQPTQPAGAVRKWVPGVGLQ